MPHMSQAVHVHLLPALVDEARLADGTVVVLDILRATTTMLAALAAGASEVVPCLTIDDARAAAERAPGPVVLGGERGGLRIDAFDLGNSPAEYTPASVGGRRVVFTTTNGTRALLLTRQSPRVLIGAFTNLRAIVEAVAADPVVHLLCAGTDRQVTGEDVLAAGAIAAGLIERNPAAALDDAARLAVGAWRDGESTGRPLADRLAKCLGGRNLTALDMAGDIELAARLDATPLVARFDPAAGGVRAVG